MDRTIMLNGERVDPSDLQLHSQVFTLVQQMLAKVQKGDAFRVIVTDTNGDPFGHDRRELDIRVEWGHTHF